MAYNEIRTINNIQLEDIKARQSIQELDNKKANKSDLVNGLNYKGTTTYSALPTSNNNVGDFYYVTDGDGTNGAGNYAWNGTAWYFSGKTTDFGDISTKANAAVNNAAFEEGKLKVTKNDGTSTETEVIDSSLTKSGKAADAKITGDKIGELEEDLNSRSDNNDALFVSERNPHNRLTKAGVEKVVRELGEKSCIQRRVYPHLIRHTTATMALQRGMDVTEIQRLLGHSNVATTMIYAKVDQNNVKTSHKKYIQ